MLYSQIGKCAWVASLVTIVTATLGGCSKQDPVFTQVSPPADKSVIYVFRNEALEESAPTFYIDIDGERVAGLRPNKYLYKIVDPGRHIVSCNSERQSSVTIDTKPGRSYYIEAEIIEGIWMGRPNLKVVNTNDALTLIGGKQHFQGKPLPDEQFQMQVAGVETGY